MKKIHKEDTENISDMLKQLGTIVAWFESERDLDVEKSLEYVKEGVVLIKKSKARLAEIENEFKEIKREISE